ncbi:MAG: sugar phosphate isomerase/epimerase [Bacteroidota bacterium]
MADRRKFLKNASALAISGLLFPGCAATAITSGRNLGSIGIQLWSVKDVIEKDLKGTLQQLATIGYKEIESYPGEKGHYYGLAPKEFKALLDGMGLTLVSSHFGSGAKTGKSGSWQQATMLQNFEELAGKAAETGQKYLTCAWMDESLRKTPEDLKQTAALFNKTGEICKKAGLQFAYHNHDFEFKKVGDVMLYDYMIENTDPALVQWEMDIYWVAAGGQDPLAYFKKYPNRFPLGHVKDMDKQDKTKNTEIGSGSLNFPELLKAAQAAGMKHFIVEQESFTRPSIESMKMNYDYLSKLAV